MNNWGQPAFARGPNSPYAISSSSNYGVCYSTNYGYSWTQSNLTTTLAGSVTMSATGQYALIGKNQANDVYITTNYGIFWQVTNDKLVAFYNNALAVSSDFKYLVSAGISGVFYQSIPGIVPSLALNSSGQYAITTATNTVYVSSNYGNSWPTSSITGSILGATTDSTGQYMAVSVDLVGIYITSNYGNSWIKSNADNGAWRMLKMSSSGNIVYALKNDGTNNYYIYSSSSYGMNWTATTSPFLKWYSITMNDTASRVFAASVLNGIYLLGPLYISIITPAATQNVTLSIVTNSATVTATSNSPGALSYYLNTSYGNTTSNASIANTFNTNVNTSVIGGSLWVGVGGAVNTLAYSNDGITWTNLGRTIFTGYAYSVAWNGTRWIAVGDGSNSIAYSSNGTTWTGITGSKSVFSCGENVAWNGTRWVATGNGGNVLAYSNNGTTWTAANNPFGSYGKHIAWNAANATINTGTVAIRGSGTVNIYATQAASGIYGELTTPTLAGTINVLTVPTIRQAATQTVIYS